MKYLIIITWQNTLKKFNLLREEFKEIGYVPAKDSKTFMEKL